MVLGTGLAVAEGRGVRVGRRVGECRGLGVALGVGLAVAEGRGMRVRRAVALGATPATAVVDGTTEAVAAGTEVGVVL